VGRIAQWVQLEDNSTIVARGIFPVGICGTGSADLSRKKYDEYGGVIRESNM
jgi:hypothetical protein